MSNIPLWKLNNGIEIPSVGFGVFKVKEGDEVYTSVLPSFETNNRTSTP